MANEPLTPTPPTHDSHDDWANRVVQLRHDLRNPLGHILGFSELLLQAARRRNCAAALTDLTFLCQESEQLIPRVTYCLDPRGLASGRNECAALRLELERFCAAVQAATARLAPLFQELDDATLREDLSRIADSGRRMLEVATHQLGPLAPPSPEPVPALEPTASAVTVHPTQPEEAQQTWLGQLLPRYLADRCRQRQDPALDSFPDVTLLAAGPADLALLTCNLSPELLLDQLRQFHRLCDQLCANRGLEVVQAPPSRCLMAGGIPGTRPDHAVAAAELALDMLEQSKRLQAPPGQPFRVKMALATGPVLAGVVGWGRHSFELWGETVERVWRLQGAAPPAGILVAGSTGERLRANYVLEELGLVAGALLETGAASRLVGARSPRPEPSSDS